MHAGGGHRDACRLAKRGSEAPTRYGIGARAATVSILSSSRRVSGAWWGTRLGRHRISRVSILSSSRRVSGVPNPLRARDPLGGSFNPLFVEAGLRRRGLGGVLRRSSGVSILSSSRRVSGASGYTCLPALLGGFNPLFVEAGLRSRCHGQPSRTPALVSILSSSRRVSGAGPLDRGSAVRG